MLYGISEQYPDDVVTHVLLNLIYDQCYLLHAKTTSFCFMFVLVIVNAIIFEERRFLTS